MPRSCARAIGGLRALEQLFGEPVTTSVTGKPQRAADAPANIEIITQDDIRRSGATTIPDVLRFVAGVDVRHYGLADADVGIRGYNQPSNPHLMVLVDGRQVYMVDYGRIVWAAIPVQLDEIRQIEVIKGPNSALYGFNAVGGVINIITYDPLQDERERRDACAAARRTISTGSAVGTGRIGDTAGLRLSVGGFNAHDFAPGPLEPGPTRRRASRRSPARSAPIGRWQITPRHRNVRRRQLRRRRAWPNRSRRGVVRHRAAGDQWSLRAAVNADTRSALLSCPPIATTRQVAGSRSPVFDLQP